MDNKEYDNDYKKDTLEEIRNNKLTIYVLEYNNHMFLIGSTKY